MPRLVGALLWRGVQGWLPFWAARLVITASVIIPDRRRARPRSPAPPLFVSLIFSAGPICILMEVVYRLLRRLQSATSGIIK